MKRSPASRRGALPGRLRKLLAVTPARGRNRAARHARVMTPGTPQFARLAAFLERQPYRLREEDQ